MTSPRSNRCGGPRCPLGRDAEYGGWSLYFDTSGLRFYWDKIEGLRFRRKLRLRHYGAPHTLTEERPVFVEIKQRVNRVTQKRRLCLPYEQARRLCDARELIDDAPEDRGFVEEVVGLVSGLDLRPITITGYQREAFAGRDAELGLRITVPGDETPNAARTRPRRPCDPELYHGFPVRFPS